MTESLAPLAVHKIRMKKLFVWGLGASGRMSGRRVCVPPAGASRP